MDKGYSKMMKEIGGYFEMEKFEGVEYHSKLLALNNARNALLYILKARKIKKIYIPYFLCDSVSKLCEREGYAYEYYFINDCFLPVFEKSLKKDEYLYIVNFYGQISNKKIRELKNKHKNVIFDNVQAFFQKPVQGIDTIYSCRKFFGVPDGGYLSTEVECTETIETDKSRERVKHLLGRFEETATEYYNDFKQNDHSFKYLPLKYMSELTHNILRAIDYKKIKRKRNKNYAILEGALSRKNKLKLLKVDAPYCYPFYCENGMEIKRKLAQKKIYVATLWPNVLQLEGMLEKDYAENILPLPCDQRYGEEDMIYILKEIEDCLSEEGK